MAVRKPITASLVVLFERDGELHLRTSVDVGRLTAATETTPATSWVQLFTIGSFKKGERKFSITPAMLSDMVENFSTGLHPVPPTELCIDYEHLSGVATDNPDAGKAAGWIKELELREDGAELWARVEWTPAAAARITAKEYKLLSPEFSFDFTTPTMEAIGPTLLAAAITNRPFLQGMQPITLTVRARGDVALLSDLSYDQQRTIVQRALRARLGATGYEPYCYVSAMNTTHVVYEVRDGYLRESYTIDADGTCTFGDDAVDVISTFKPPAEAALRSGDTDMKTITLKGTDGKDIQVPEDALEQSALVKELRTQLADRVPKSDIAPLLAKVATLEGDVTALKTENEASALALRTRDADTAVEALVAAGKASNDQRASLKELYLSQADHKLFDQVTAGFSTRVVAGEIGHARPGAVAGGAVAQVNAEVATLRAADPKLTVETAIERVLAKDATLYARYVKETEQPVGKGA